MTILHPPGLPSLISDVSFDLDEPSENLRFLSALKAEKGRTAGKVRLRTNELIQFKRTGTEFGSIFAEYGGRLAVHIKYRVYNYSFLPARSIMQSVLWKDSELPITNFFSPRLFFDVMMNESNALLTVPLALLTDEDRTSYEKEFWRRRTHEALLQGLNVALVDFDESSYRSITNHIELEEMLGKSLEKENNGEEVVKTLPLLIWKNWL